MNLPISLTVALYLVATLLLGWRLRAGEAASNGFRGPALGLGVVAVFAHGWLLQQALWQDAGLDLNLGHALSLFSWLSALLLCLLSLRRPLENLGLVLFPFAAVGTALGLAWRGSNAVLVEAGWALQLHIVLSVLAYGVLTLAAVQALVLAVQDRQLHRHRSGGWLRVLPPLQTMEQLLFELTATGFFLLSLALLSGLVFVEDLLAQHLAHKTFFSVLAWLFYALLLWGHWRFGWRGRTATRGTLIGYLTLVLAYFGSKFVLEQLLGTHWA
ncbi:MAG TPA: cytochrome c biogenesis protein CcsA [Nevskiales bacterium]|nr:cytochrome c biogenesis protein CcsA [Nevskiales bacterium]